MKSITSRNEPRYHCHVNSNAEGDRFVGISIKNDIVEVSFPLGYNLASDPQELQRDILKLIALLASIGKPHPEDVPSDSAEKPLRNHEPIAAYFEIIYDYLRKGHYYTENESVFKVADKGKIHWGKTIKKITPLVTSSGNPIFTSFVVRHSPPCEEKLITQIHKFCVFESFKKFGWLFTPFIPEKPPFLVDRKLSEITLLKKISLTNNDSEKKLFGAMLAVIKANSDDTHSAVFTYGTDSFEYVWEELIDRVFGISNKKDYFPQTSWDLELDEGNGAKYKSPLEPDTIMRVGEKFFVLDAKYYKFGVTHRLEDLPGTSSIHKQITYGEFVHKKEFSSKLPDDVYVYNAFLMPANLCCSNHELAIKVIGKAKSDWKKGQYRYENILGIVVDVKSLIYCYKNDNTQMISLLADSIIAEVDKSFKKTE